MKDLGSNRTFNSTPYALAGVASFDTAPVRVYMVVAQNLSATTNTKLVYGTTEFAIGSVATASWSSVNNRYTAQVTGLYSVRGAYKTTGTNRNIKIMIYKNGVFYCNLCDYNTTALASPFIYGSRCLQLNANDYIELWAYSNAATTGATGSDVAFEIMRTL